MHVRHIVLALFLRAAGCLKYIYITFISICMMRNESYNDRKSTKNESIENKY